MYRLIFNLKGDGHPQFPRKDHDILHQLKTYVDKEHDMAEALRVNDPSYSTMRDLYTRLSTASHDADSHERTRALARDNFNTLFTTLKEQADKAVLVLKARYLNTPQQLEDWGLEAAGAGREATVRKPESEDDWLHLFDRYVEKEESLPAAERVAGVHFGDFQRGLRELHRLDAEWRAAWRLRQAAVENRTRLAEEALANLRWALLALAMKHFGGALDQDMEAWGFRIIWPEGSEATAETGAEEGDD